MSTISAQQISTPPGTNSSRALPLTEPFQLGDWLVQPGLNRLVAATGENKQLEPRLMHLLCYLAANQTGVVSREELVQELWPRVIVNENSLTRAISELRKQLHNGAKPQDLYIETIPKKGYRLLPAARAVQPSLADTMQIPNQPIFRLLRSMNMPGKVAIAALCLSVALGSGFRMAAQPALNIHSLQPALLADEIVDPTPSFYGGEMTLSTAEDPERDLYSMEQPIISHAGDRYAYIKYDNTGSTIFLGGLAEMSEPIAIYNCATRLYNLSWSPLGDSLLFAQQAKLTTAALYSSEQESGELIMLELDNYRSSRLVKDTAPSTATASSKLNLT